MSNSAAAALDSCVADFFAENYPLIRLLEYGGDILLYDAKPHLAFVLSRAETEVLRDFLAGRPEEAITRAHSTLFSAGEIASLLAKFTELGNAGVFLEGPVAEISPVDRTAVREQLRYFNDNILLRKFCLGVTEDCNFRCTYCKRTIGGDYAPFSTTTLAEDDACRAIDYYFSKYTGFFLRLPGDKRDMLLEAAPPGLSWYGGEPFLNFPLIRATADYFRNLPWGDYGIPSTGFRFTSNTNLSIINDEIIDFLIANRVLLFASLDGPADEHDRCRVFAGGRGTFDTAYRNLMRIKDADPSYFRECVSIFGVYTSEHDFGRCVDFTRHIGALRCHHFPAEYCGTFVPDPAVTAASYDESLPVRVAAFKAKAALSARAEIIDMNEFGNLFQFASLNCDMADGKQALQLLITCPMGFDNLMVAANGDFLICHKVDGAMPIGSCRSGLDIEKLGELYQHYNATVNNPECRSCWSVRFCPVCAASRMTGSRFINPSRSECDHFRQRAAFDFLCFIHLSLEHPDLLERILDHTRDRRNFVGIIDLNDF